MHVIENLRGSQQSEAGTRSPMIGIRTAGEEPRLDEMGDFALSAWNGWAGNNSPPFRRMRVGGDKSVAGAVLWRRQS